MIAGFFALLVPALALLAWQRHALLVPIAFLALAGAGIAAATGAGEPVSAGEGAFGPVAQLLALIGLFAALVSVGSGPDAGRAAPARRLGPLPQRGGGPAGVTGTGRTTASGAGTIRRGPAAPPPVPPHAGARPAPARSDHASRAPRTGDEVTTDMTAVEHPARDGARPDAAPPARVPFPVVDEVARHCLQEEEPETVHIEVHLPGPPGPRPSAAGLHRGPAPASPHPDAGGAGPLVPAALRVGADRRTRTWRS